jgi:death-on-curing protein
VTRYLSLEGFVVELEAIGFQVRDLGLVHSAIERPATTLMGREAYPTIELKCAAQTESLARNHPFVDGNKRSSWIALNHLLRINGHLLFATQDDAFDFIQGVAKGQLSLEDSAEWIAERSRKI